MIPPVGAFPLGGGATRFTVWAPAAHLVAVRVGGDRMVPLEGLGGGYHGGIVDDCPAGTRYRLALDGREFADPASRAQPQGVHGPSEVVDLAAHRWADSAYRPRPLWDHVLYEIHIGTYTSGGTFDSAVGALDELCELGVSAVEIMPVAQFPGRRNWGYDGVFPFAVQDSYGGPRGLQRLVDACHQRDLAVFLDVVYNHLGPEGNVLGEYGSYFTDRYRTPWGPAVNFDGPGSDDVRAFFLQNARQWFADFHIDGLRLDAVHEIIDRTAVPFLAELSAHAKEWSERLGRPCHLIPESSDNDPRLVTVRDAGGLGMDAQWNDDFHHALHVSLTGERDGYYADYHGTDDLALAMTEGFVLQGRYSPYRRRRHGGSSRALALEKFLVFAQNHDHVGNRPRGERLSSLVPPEVARLAAALLLLSPGIPLLFMGEDYAETAPFPYFVDHGDPALVEAVRTGRAREFEGMASDGPPFDPADPATFEMASLDHTLRAKGDHAILWDLYRHLIALRRATPALRRSTPGSARAWVSGSVLTLVRAHPQGAVTALFNPGPEKAASPLPAGELPEGFCWTDLIDTGRPALSPGATVSLDPWGFAAFCGREVAP